MSAALALAIGAPLAGAAVNGLLGRRLPRGVVAAVGVGAPLVSLIVAVRAAVVLASQAEPIRVVFFEWIAAGSLAVPAAFVVDRLSSVMFLVVTGVGWLIHVYSLGYMAHDRGLARYFSYLNLFIGSMLVLVLADNLPLMFVGWEGVGLCSFLLIGFWFDEEERARAGQKAFVVNRIGDLGFLVGIFLAWSAFGTVQFEGLRHAVAAGPAATAVGLLLFAGAVGKSAQIPLYVWLPDAMAGPTPVSALIHAATMVTAGVYMMCRMAFLYDAAPVVQAVVAGVAAATALLAATIATAQWNIKKVLAYSTISQLAFMFAGAAAGAYAAAIFHLVTHAFFKALLFLAAGAVIHALGGEEDMRRMGGLGGRLPLVAILFAVGALAMGGPLAGFFSKEAVVVAAYERGWTAVWVVLLVTGGLTAFYIARAFLVSFVVPAKGDHHGLHRPGRTMVVPMVALAIPSVGGMALGGWLESWLGWKTPHGGGPTMTLSIVSILVGYGAAFLACVVARRGVRVWLESQPLARWIVGLVERRFFVDEIYQAVVVLPVRMLAFGLWLVVDRWLVDGALVGAGPWLVARTGGALRRTSSGAASTIVAAILTGAALLIGAWLAARWWGG